MTGLLPVKITCWLSQHTYCFTKLLRFLQTDLLAWSIKICKGNKYQELKQTLQGKIKRGIFYMKNNKNWLTKINHFTLLYSKHTKTRHVCPTVTWFVYTLHTGSKQRRRLTYIEILQHLSHFMGKFIQTVLKVKQIKTDFTNKTHYINITETLLNLTWW